MSGESSSEVAWYSRLEPESFTEMDRRGDDPRLGEVIACWHGDAESLRRGRAVLVGFPQDEGVRRNRGRPGAAAAPREIRRHLSRLTPWDGQSGTDLTILPPLDAGNLRVQGNLEETQQMLADVVGGILATRAVPIVLGGGHETAYGHFLGYRVANRPMGIINIDAHLDVRPCLAEGGHSGSPFRQAMEHATQPLPGSHYVCLGARPHCVSRAHLDYVHRQGGKVVWASEVKGSLREIFAVERDRLAQIGCQVCVTIDADALAASEVPGVSAPNVLGLSGAEVMACARLAGRSAAVSSFELVEINPLLDRDGQSARWASLVIWYFLMGLAERVKQGK